jgi:hypothetical protein
MANAMTESEKDPRKVAGALARAKALTPLERKEIARRAAVSRWGRDLPRAVAEGNLPVGDALIPCAVLDDGPNTRVLTQEGFLTAVGRAGKAKGGEGASVDGRPAFMRAKNLEPFISNELLGSTTPIEFVPLKGPGYQGRAFGYRASILPRVCWVYHDAETAGKLLPSQAHIAKACTALLRALTDHAIDDLVDRATGFDDIRKREALHRILEKYVSAEALPWTKRFKDEFYQQIFRLNRWPYDPEKVARPSVIGIWTNDIYDRLAPGVRAALHERVRRNSKGRPTQKLHQFLTKEDGLEELRDHLNGVTAIMRGCDSWDQFQVLLEKSYPKVGDTMQLPLPEPRRLPRSL